MIWYLLYPFRGTTEAPVLGQNHPLRIAASRYGIYAARHVVTTLLISVTVATALIYPIPFLFTTDFKNGASNLPRHVWTVAKPLDYKTHVEPDVIMRSIWVHGSYMEALNQDVLLGALELQDALLGTTRNFDPRNPAGPAGHGGTVTADDTMAGLDPEDRDMLHVINGLTDQSWFFHSPLLYWSCSPEKIATDTDIISTVNQRKTQSTSVNITLRHSIVFSGKRFAERRLLAADALVITLIHLRNSPVAEQWMRRAQLLPPSIADKWTMYPPDGRSLTSDLYEFQFRPISTQDSVLLALAYGLTLVYCLLSLSKLRAVKSKFGLSVTVITQIAVSIMSSFTVCAIFDVDLSRIPRTAYPLAILSLSLENIFRLINAVILTPAEDSTCNRIGYAFGHKVHVSLAGSAQNALILWALSYVVSPGVSAFCVFAVIVIFFDFFYLSTFFLSVLSVDVRRTELSESLAKASLRRHRHRNCEHPRQSWAEAVLQGRVALSTRISGTIVTVAFVLIAQWHFFEDETIFRFLTQLFHLAEFPPNNASSRSSALVDVHQARSPTSWLRLQDHETAREVIQVVKPLAHSYVARVYEPLVFVLKGSDRVPHTKEGPFLPAAYDFIHHQLVPFVVVVLFAVAAVRLLTNYLLWEGEAEFRPDSETTDGSLFSIRSLHGGHALDVARIVASADGHVVSIGLDRRIQVWDVRRPYNSYEITELGKPGEEMFPIIGMAIDEDSSWLALLTRYQILLWSFVDKRWAPTTPVDLCGQRPEAFFFVPSQIPHVQSLVLVRKNGTMTQIWPSSTEATDRTICQSPLTCASLLVQKVGGAQRVNRYSVLSASRDGYLYVTTQHGPDWIPRRLALEQVPCCESSNGGILQVLPIPVLDAVLAVYRESVSLVDITTGELVKSLATEPIQPGSLKALYSRRRMLHSGLSGLTSFTLVYMAADSGDCVIQAYSAADDNDDGGCDIIHMHDSSGGASGRSYVWLNPVQITKHVCCPGKWEVLPSGYIIGVRPKQKTSPAAGKFKEQEGPRYRKCAPLGNHQGSISWEVWLVSQLSKLEGYDIRPLLRDEEASGLLVISEVGPLAKVGRNSVALGFGNVIKIVTVGNSHLADIVDGTEDDGLLHLGSRRRKNGPIRGKLTT